MRTIGRLKALVLAALAVSAAFSIAALAPGAAAAPLRLTLVHVNDWDQMAGIKGAGGAAKIAAVVAEERARAAAEGGLAVVTFGGDMISPSVLSGIDEGAHMIDLANAVGFDVAVLGNHEFDFGLEVLRQRLAESETVWLAGNVSVAGGSFPGSRATTVIERDGYRIGFLGLVTEETPVISSPGPDVAFAPVVDAGAALAGSLKVEGADIVIALTHQGLGADLELLRTVRAIDVVLGGHDHLLVANHDGRQAVMKAGSQGRHVGVLTLAIDRVEGRGGAPRVVWTPDFRLRSTAGIAGDAVLAAKVQAYQARLDETLDVVIGETATELDTRGFLSGSAETAFGNLLADAMREATSADVALSNGGGIRGDTIYPPGTRLTRKMVLTELPFGNKTVVLRLTGAQIRQALENGVSRAQHPSGRFPQVSGLAFSFDGRGPPGARVTRVTIGGKPLEDTATYTLATNDFLARGGDDYRVFKAGEVVVDSASGSLMAGQLIDHIIAAGTVAPVIEGRITRED
ncbi:MAG: 5'-nucleotidase C-terminal domain-containing protein [Rhodospirillales bacterium]|nr:5'-nucleotidase C-terminal domain-containing protein [Rhodospirillales bacterium]MDE0379866.1 5'-nucleotidase C-terminal domain-containing protein [Rhodospirillales bacterium]